LSRLLASIPVEAYTYVVEFNSSYEVWQILERSFGYVSENRLLQLHIQLQELTTDDESVAQFL
jgi:hypothetical protein